VASFSNFFQEAFSEPIDILPCRNRFLRESAAFAFQATQTAFHVSRIYGLGYV